MQKTAARSCEHSPIPGETHMDVNTSVTGGLGGSWRCPLCWEPNQMNKPERCRGLDGLREGWTERKNQGSKRNGLELVICLQEEKDPLWEKATLMVHHDDVEEIPEGNLPSLTIEELGKVESTMKRNLKIDSIYKYLSNLNSERSQPQKNAYGVIAFTEVQW